MRWLQERYTAPLARAFQLQTGRPVELNFRVRHPGTDGETHRDPPPPDLTDGCTAERPAPQAVIPQSAPAIPATSPPPTSPEGPCFRLSNFVVGASNRFAWSAAQEVCKDFYRHYNPFLLLADTGLGKTHLGEAIAHRLRRKHGEGRVVFCTAERLFSDLIQHMKSRSVHRFKERYRDACEALVLDDIQFVLGKRALQDELCYTLDTLLNRGRQVVLLGNLPSRECADLSESLRSRFFSGLCVSIDPPDHATRVEILQRLSERSGISLPRETLETVARQVRSNVRDLEGALNRIVAAHRLFRRPLDPQTVERHLQPYLQNSPGTVTIVRIQEHVARFFGLPPEALASRSRQKKVLYPRQIGMYLSRKHTHESLEAIGALYRRDHSSVVYAIRSLEKKIAQTPRLAREVLFIEEKLLEGV